MIYNFNLGIGWASSGVEYAQAYRAAMLRNIGQPARFIFTDMFPRDPLAHMTRNIGFRDEEILWLYLFFTDQSVKPVTYTLAQLESTFAGRTFKKVKQGNIARYLFEGNNNFYTAYLTDPDKELVHRVEMVSKGYLIRKDYFTDRRSYTEYYAPKNGKAELYMRRFFNQNGSVAYEEMVHGENSVFRFPDRMVFSKGELVGLMVSRLGLTEKDTIIIDRTTGIGQAILQNAGPARVGIVIHAEHYSAQNTNDVNILWNNYYEYAFAQHSHVNFYIASTDVQNRLLRRQFRKYMEAAPRVVTIPVGGIPELKRPQNSRRTHSLITVSRLASEKHVDWVVGAVSLARKKIPDLTLDIYGQGVMQTALEEQIKKLGLEKCIRLMGQHKMDEVYKEYEAYIAGSTSEGFGLSLMEAVGSGLPIIGFDVPYGNQTFIDDGQNGYLIPYDKEMDSHEKEELLAERIVQLFCEADLEAFHEHSYKKAEKFMTSEVEKGWKKLLRRTV